MTVEFAGLRLKNPVIAASGTFGYGLEWESVLDLNELGGLVTKGLSLEPMPGNKPPRLAVTLSGMLNSVGLQNVGVDAFIRDKLPRLAALQTVVIANVFGYETGDYIEVVRRLESATGVAALELNLSCPNTKQGGITFGNDPRLIEEVTGAARKQCTRPLIVKLSPNVADIAPYAHAAEASGADAISLVNTFTGPHPERAERDAAGQTLGGGAGGLSGPAIRADALRLVSRAVQAVRIPVIGIGGILCGADAVAFLEAGAVAVQVGTANFYDPLATLRIARELADYCLEGGFASVRELIRTEKPTPLPK
ncbi:MAG: dihydroorotate dehydrogenase [Acidobacteria bacterium]|nr:dihydroorotate dehydrogenase [Acidobacteriota bacterium]